MEGKKVGLQVPRDETSGSLDHHGVTSAVRAVTLEEETGGVFVANALKQQEIVADKELHGGTSISLSTNLDRTPLMAAQ